MHVTLGTLMLIIITTRLHSAISSPTFSVTSASKGWPGTEHFVDLVWIGLFTFVYVL